MRAVTIPITKSDRSLTLLAGPYRERVEGTFGMLLASELKELDHDYHLPCKDFGVPDTGAYEKAVSTICLETAIGDLVYIGCMGGIGRTGTVMAGVVRVLQECSGEQAIGWVRHNYLGHAVETKAQQTLVGEFDAPKIRRSLEMFAPVLFQRRSFIERLGRWITR